MASASTYNKMKKNNEIKREIVCAYVCKCLYLRQKGKRLGSAMHTCQSIIFFFFLVWSSGDEKKHSRHEN